MSATYSQLTIDGGEVAAPAVPRRVALSAGQLDILRVLACRNITSSDAGRIMHAHRDPPCDRCRRGSCAFIASDGGDALKRLQDRGYVRRLAPGLWTARQR